MKTIMTMLMLLFVTTVMAQWNCGDPLVDTRDGKIYQTILIGNQCWIKKNMNIGSMAAGNVSMTNNGVFEKYCYANLESNCEVYGGLYQWNEAMQYSTVEGSQGICPLGWHIPSLSEYEELISFVGNNLTAGGNLKETGTSHWVGFRPYMPINNLATNSSGFTALPAGLRWDNWAFYNKGADFEMWLSSVPPSDERNPYYCAYYGGASYGHAKALGMPMGTELHGHFYIQEGLSVRCLKD